MRKRIEQVVWEKRRRRVRMKRMMMKKKMKMKMKMKVVVVLFVLGGKMETQIERWVEDGK